MASGRIKGITIEIEGKTTKLESSLKAIDSQLNKTQSALKDTNKLLKFNPGNTDLLKQKQKQLADSINQTKTRLDQLREAQSKVDEGTAEWDALQREIVDTENRLKSLEKEYRNFGSVNAQVIAAAGEKLKGYGEKMTEVGQSLTTKVTLPLVAAGTLSAKKFAEVDKTMQLVNSTMSNSEEEAKLLDSAMKEAAANSTFGMNEAATATLNFARAGLNAEEAANALAPAMALAAGEGGNLDVVSGGLVATINGFGGSFEDAGYYADVFANACNNSALNVDELSSAMSIAAPIFHSAGYEVKDAALYMGIMANKGIDANVAANSLKTGMARLITPSKEGAEWMDKLGISVTNADGTMKDSVQIQKEMHDSFMKLSDSERIAAAEAIFGKNQMAPWLALIETAPEDVDKLNNSLDKEGTAMEMQTAMMEGFGGAIEKLKSSIDVAATSLGQALAPTIMKVAEVIQKAVDWFNSLDESQQQLIAKIGLVAAAVGPLLLIGGKLLIGIGQLMTFAPQILAFGGAITKVFGIAKAAIAGLSFNPVILGIAAAVAAGIWLYKHWDQVKEWAASLAAWISAKWEAIKLAITSKIDAAKAKVQAAVEAIRAATIGKFEAARSGAVAKFESMRSAAASKFESIRSAAASKFESIKTAITSKIEAAKDKVKGVIDKIKGFFPFKVGKIINFKTPHISLNTSTKKVLGKSITYPTGFSVSWYKKAYDTPVEFTRSMIVPTMNGLKGFGDGRGSEVVYGRRKLAQDVAAIIGSRAFSAPVNINVYARDGQSARQIAREVKTILINEVNNQRVAWA